MTQQRLFPEPTLGPLETLSEKVRRDLSSLVSQGVECLRWQEGYKVSAEAVERKLSSFPGGCFHYLIRFEEKTIGYLAIWDGWIGSEMEQGEPLVEMGIVARSAYQRWKGVVEDTISAELSRLTEQVKDDW